MDLMLSQASFSCSFVMAGILLSLLQVPKTLVRTFGTSQEMYEGLSGRVQLLLCCFNTICNHYKNDGFRIDFLKQRLAKWSFPLIRSETWGKEHRRG